MHYHAHSARVRETAYPEGLVQQVSRFVKAVHERPLVAIFRLHNLPAQLVLDRGCRIVCGRPLLPRNWHRKVAATCRRASVISTALGSHSGSKVGWKNSSVVSSRTADSSLMIDQAALLPSCMMNVCTPFPFKISPTFLAQIKLTACAD